MVKAAKVKKAVAAEPVTNGIVSARLEEAAELLSRQGANEFRVRAYRRGAETVRGMTPPVADVFEELGIKGLLRLPGIGDSLARSIERVLTTGRMPVLERLRACASPARIFTTGADIGP
jgi:putative hydrolase